MHLNTLQIWGINDPFTQVATIKSRYVEIHILYMHLPLAVT